MIAEALASVKILDFGLPTFAISVLLILLLRQVRENLFWRATITPLASIIGSGFLIVAPLLGRVVGGLAPWAMGLIVVIAYLIGSIIRFNIRYAVRQPQNHTASSIPSILDHISNLGLLGAYVISVAFYLRLMSAFLLDGLDALSETNANILTTGVLLFIGLVGWRRGLHTLEHLEEYSVSIKLAIIAAFLLGLGFYGSSTGLWHNVPARPPGSLMETARLLAGTLLVVQGFETSRYLGREYTSEMRVRSMRFAQGLSTLIYVGFAFLILPLLQFIPDGPLEETAIINLSQYISPVLPVMLVIAATMSQFSAAIADTLGGGGLVYEESRGRFPSKYGYLIITVCAVLLIWSTSIFEIVAYASRAFAFYYFVQTLIAFHTVSQWQYSGRKYLLLSEFGVMSGFLLWVTVYAIPLG